MAKSKHDAARGNTRMRFEQWARNPTCEANTFSAVHNVKMADVARSVGIEPSFGQSPFALVRGQNFEASLFARDGARLFEQLIETAVIPPGPSNFFDLRLRMNGGKRIVTLDGAIEATSELILDAASDRPTVATPLLVAGATVRIPRGVMLPEAILIIDALVVRHGLDRPQVMVGEIKAYPDRGGYTDPGELASARAQAGLYVHALQIVVESLGIGDRIEISERGFLVFTRPGSNWPSIRADEDLRYQALRASRGFDLLERAATILPDFVSEEGEPLEAQLSEAVLSRGHSYSEGCLSFCDMAPSCHAEALSRGDAIVLGDDVRRFVGGIRLDRVMQLMGGAVASDAAEQDFVRRVHDAEQVEVS
jgi:hypothetical protein